MEGFIASFFVGVLLVVLGALNIRGDISMLHSYHTHRVSEEDRAPFGKKIGLGTVICGASVSVFSILSFLSLYLNNQILLYIGTGALILGLICGLGLIFYALFKYNKGIF